MLGSRISGIRGAVVEPLESRCLLSASHGIVPVLTGAAFTGVATATDGNTGTIVLNVTSETKKGACKGNATITVLGQTLTAYASGTVNAKGKCSMHFSARHLTLTVNGTATATTITGKFNLGATMGKHHIAAHGTYSLGRSPVS